MPTVVSISAKPRTPASAASAAIWTGLSFTLVTWHWFAGIRRARILDMPIMISTIVIFPTTSVSFAGVMERVISRISLRETLMSTILRAISRESSAMAFSAFSRRMAWSAIKVSNISKSARHLPSSSVTRPFSILMLGVGSKGLFMAIRPTSGHSLT